MDSGGFRVAQFLGHYGVKRVFTLCGGHISPILVACEKRDIAVIDVRDEATAVFAAESTARLSGQPGVAVLTAGPGLTNGVTPLQNAKSSGTPLLVLGGAAPTVLKGRGALQEVDHLALLRPCVKRAYSVRRRRELLPTLEEALVEAYSGMPGPVFVEIPMDLLYPKELVKEWYRRRSSGTGFVAKLAKWWQERQLQKLLEEDIPLEDHKIFATPYTPEGEVAEVAHELAHAERPLLLLGSPVALDHANLRETIQAVEKLGIPTYLSGMARGLLPKDSPLLLRHRRREALKEADFILLVGVPCDFRLNYGLDFARGAHLVLVHPDGQELRRNRDISRLRGIKRVEVHGHPPTFLRKLAKLFHSDTNWQSWLEKLRERDRQRAHEISQKAERELATGLSPLWLLQQLNQWLPDNTTLIGDGGDFVATASYLLDVRHPLGWLDPGPFGTLGVGAGFALGAKLARSEELVVILYGDGALGYSLAEFDTFCRYGLGVIALVGNDGAWSQIQRDQEEILGAPTATELRQCDYYRVVEGFGAKGILVEHPDQWEKAWQEAYEAARKGVPVLLDCRIQKSDFRKGSISV